MKITLIKPTIGRKEHSLYIDEGRMEPLMLGLLAALTPSDVEVVLYDDRMENIPYDEQTDLVGITVETYTARRAYEIADEFRQRGIPVIMGGIHVALIPEEVQAYCDSIFIGDAETLWGQVVMDARKGRLKKIYQAPPGIAQAGGVKPRRDLFEGKGYLPLTLVQYSRGCRYACSFCAVSSYFSRQHYIRRIDEVLEEIISQKRRFIFFVDDNIAGNHQALRDLCLALIPLKINWISQASLDVTHDRKLMRVMADSGCIGHVMGFESINRASLKAANKWPNMTNYGLYRREIETLQAHGMQTWAAFTLGYDHDTPESIKATMEFALKNKFTFAAFNILMPYPKTPLFDKLHKQGRLLYGGKWWLHPQYRFNQASFLPNRMSPDELTDACHNARKRFNSISSLIYRFSDIKTNVRTLWRAASYWRYTILFRKELYKKHKMKFGLR